MGTRGLKPTLPKEAPQMTSYYSDRGRHLVCYPYGVQALHDMAVVLGIKRCWYHGGARPHYDIPKRRLQEIAGRSHVVPSRVILRITKGGQP
jgi:hypothetical protein